jgi:antitoxin CptB
MSRASRARWLCRRGMKELDVLLERYMDERWARAGEAERDAFERLLELQDPQLWDWLSGRGRPQERDLADVVSRLRGEAPD